MKSAVLILLTTISIHGYSQSKRTVPDVNQNRNLGSSATVAPGQTGSGTNLNAQRRTITNKYLNGQNATTSGSANTTGSSSPFVGGVTAANNASKTFDTASASGTTANTRTTNINIAGGNDTTFNVNTISQGGVTTNAGAVDRSGQAQFGQTNWGNSRSTVGESQWTVPPPITASFNKEFPASNSATWTRNNVDTTIYSAKYKVGAQWVTTNYNASGQRMDMRTEYPLVQPPRPIAVFIAKQPAGFEAETIYKLQIQGKPDVYEIRTKTGKTVYVNNDGMEVNY